jgi:hypothetical protein
MRYPEWSVSPRGSARTGLPGLRILKAFPGFAWLANLFAAASESLVPPPGPRVPSGPSMFELSPPAGQRFRVTVWPEPKYAMAFPVLPALFFLGVAILVLALADPGARSLLGLGHPPQPLTSPDVRVWVDRDRGIYSCPGSVLFGRGPGRAMAQAQALSLGYQPAVEAYCTNTENSLSASHRRGNATVGKGGK